MAKKFKPTWSKTYPSAGAPQPKNVTPCRVAIVMGSTKGTILDSYDDKLSKTAPMMMRREVLRKHGKKALSHSFKK